jgi:hypothetical protein
MRCSFAAVSATPLIRFDDPAGQDSTVGLESLANDFEAELVEAAELGQVRASEGGVRHVCGRSRRTWLRFVAATGSECQSDNECEDGGTEDDA